MHFAQFAHEFRVRQRHVHETLLHAGVRSELDERSDTLGFKIREAELHKVPVMLVVGDQEEAAGSVTPRFRHRPAAEAGAMALSALVAELLTDIRERRITRPS